MIYEKNVKHLLKGIASFGSADMGVRVFCLSMKAQELRLLSCYYYYYYSYIYCSYIKGV